MAAAAAEELLKPASDIFNPESGQILVLADAGTPHGQRRWTGSGARETKFGSFGTDGESARPGCQAQETPAKAVPVAVGRLCDCYAVVMHAPGGCRRRAVCTNTRSGKGNDRSEHRFNAVPATRDGDEVEELAGEIPQAMACGGVLQCSTSRFEGWNRGAGTLATSTFAMPRRRCGLPRPSGDRSVSQTACPARGPTGMQSTWPQPTSAVWRGT